MRGAADPALGVDGKNGLTIEPAFQTLLSANGLTCLDALFSVRGVRTFHKPGLPRWRERIRLELPDSDGRLRAFYLKRYTSPPVGGQLQRILAGRPMHGTAWVEWDRMCTLAAHGVRVPQPVAFGEDRLGPWERRSAVVMAELPGESLERWVIRNPRRVPREWRDTLARFVARFHGNGFVHRDLYLSHVFIENTGGDAPAFGLIDLQRVFQPRWCLTRWIIKDLAALNFSTPRSVATLTDRLRWLHVYLGVPKLRGPDRVLVRRIAARTRRMERHERKRESRPRC